MRIIAGESRGRKLRTVRRGATRPTMDRVRESLFAILTPWLEDCHFLDIFAGTGSVGLEALSRGAERAVFVESNRDCASVIRENLDLMGCSDSAAVAARPWNAGLTQLSGRETFGIIFADPPYEQEAILLKVAEEVLHRNLLVSPGWLVFQHTVRLHLPDEFGEALRRVDTRRFGETVLTFYRVAD